MSCFDSHSPNCYSKFFLKSLCFCCSSSGFLLSSSDSFFALDVLRERGIFDVLMSKLLAYHTAIKEEFREEYKHASRSVCKAMYSPGVELFLMLLL